VTFTVESVHPLKIKERCVAEGMLLASWMNPLDFSWTLADGFSRCALWINIPEQALQICTGKETARDRKPGRYRN
jgi:hypothetical protein